MHSLAVGVPELESIAIPSRLPRAFPPPVGKQANSICSMGEKHGSKSTVAHLIELGRSLALKTPNDEHKNGVPWCTSYRKGLEEWLGYPCALEAVPSNLEGHVDQETHRRFFLLLTRFILLARDGGGITDGKRPFPRCRKIKRLGFPLEELPKIWNRSC